MTSPIRRLTPGFPRTPAFLGAAGPPGCCLAAAERAAAHGPAYVAEGVMLRPDSERPPGGAEPMVWELAGGARRAFENRSDVLSARLFRQAVVWNAGVVADAAP